MTQGAAWFPFWMDLSKSEALIVAAMESVDDVKNQGDGVKMVSYENKD